MLAIFQWPEEEKTITICILFHVHCITEYYLLHCIGEYLCTIQSITNNFFGFPNFPNFQRQSHCCVIMNEEDLGYLFLFGNLVITNMWKTSVAFLTHLDFPLVAPTCCKICEIVHFQSRNISASLDCDCQSLHLCAPTLSLDLTQFLSQMFYS